MLEHARDGGLRVQDEVASIVPQQWHVTNELQCVAEPVAAADQHAFSVERFSAPRRFLVSTRASKLMRQAASKTPQRMCCRHRSVNASDILKEGTPVLQVLDRQNYCRAKSLRSFSLAASHSSPNRRTSEASCFSRESASSVLP